MPEQPLVELTLEHLFQKLVALVSWASAVAVDEEEPLFFYGLDNRIAVHFKPEFVV